jgi:hypothetical protein
MTKKELSLNRFLFCAFLATFSTRMASAQAHPDLSGIWSSMTATPLERPAQFKDQAFFTKDEAAAFERRAAERTLERPGDNAVRNYNEVFYEPGTRLSKTLRTSIVVEPADGRIPALTPAAAAVKKQKAEAMKHPSSVKDMGLQDRCLAFGMAIPPMIPYRYNSNYQFLQTGDVLMINAEMAHETRVIPLDGRAHAAPNLRFWLGDSVGHWEGATLVVDTTNFNDAGGFYGDAGGMYGWDRNMHVVERFSLLDANTILYRFEVEDPSAYTQPWKGELTFRRVSQPPFEYACHEGNRDLGNILKLSAPRQ